MTAVFEIGDPVRVVLADANVLYSRVLRDYLLYAADEEIISISWSELILGEVTRHLVGNVPGFTEESGRRLTSAMNAAFPLAQVEPGAEQQRRLEGFVLPDEGDRHVLAAALAAEATVLCTANTRDFPEDIAAFLGVEVMTPDALLIVLIDESASQMLAVHARTVSGLAGATSESTVAALRRAGAAQAAIHMARLLAGG